jgi:NAD(P)H-hydrate repair Nnr-like enzyme with NAD(P)H-hydrate dehydratase domain
VLAGVTGALLAQADSDVGRFREAGMEPEARWAAVAALGAALHGKAGRAASDACSGGPITAGGVADAIPEIWGKVSTLSNSGVRKRNSHTLPLR